MCAVGHDIPELLVSNQLGSQLGRHVQTLCIDQMNQPLTSDMWCQICMLQKLRVLKISSKLENMPGLADVPNAISQLCHLNRLSLRDEEANYLRESFSACEVSALSSLTYLELTGADRNCLAAACCLSALQLLKVWHAGGTLLLPSDLARLSSLSRLELGTCDLGGHIEALTGLQGLQEFQCGYLSVDPELIASFYQAMGQLTSLTLVSLLDFDHYGCYADDGIAVQPLQALSHLHSLSLSGSGLQALLPQQTGPAWNIWILAVMSSSSHQYCRACQR